MEHQKKVQEAIDQQLVEQQVYAKFEQCIANRINPYSDLPVEGFEDIIDILCIKYKISPIIYNAIENNCERVVDYLLRQGYNLKVEDEDDQLIRMAVLKGNKDIVKMLVNAGADPHVDNDWLFCLACSYGHSHLVRYLLEIKFDPRTRQGSAIELVTSRMTVSPEKFINKIKTIAILIEYGITIDEIEKSSKEVADMYRSACVA